MNPLWKSLHAATFILAAALSQIAVLNPLCAEETDFAKRSVPLLKSFCLDCHNNQHAEADINLERLMGDRNSFAKEFKTWRRAALMLEDNLMPPKDSEQPKTVQRKQLIASILKNLDQTAKQHAHDPGVVPLRRLTSAEYNYVIHDLTGQNFNLHQELAGDAVGGEGFSNVGLVQFMQDSTLEQYLKTAKRVASHAVIGAGLLRFSEAPGKTGQELSAIARIQAIYRKHGFRTAAGEGGEAFGLDRYPKAFFVAWQYQHRNRLGLQNTTWNTLAKAEGLEERFVRHISKVLNTKSPQFPLKEIVTRWQKLPVPSSDRVIDESKVRAKCEAIHQVMLDWQSRFGKNPDAKEEAPLLAVDTFHVTKTQNFEMNINWPKGTQAAHLQVAVHLANREGKSQAIVVWKNPEIQYRMEDGELTPFRPLKTIAFTDSVQKLQFGKHPKQAKIGPQDFVTDRAESPIIRIPIPKNARLAKLQVQAELDVEHGEDCIVRCTISQQEDTDQGKSVSGILANPLHVDYSAWKAGVLEFARLLPQVSHREPAPSDRDPIPAAFDASYNNAERNWFHYNIKYHRDDRFLVENILSDETRIELDAAWQDLLGAFDYHKTYLQFLAKKYRFGLGERTIATIKPAWIDQLPAKPQSFVKALVENYQTAERAYQHAHPEHINQALAFASKTWRRPLTEPEKFGLRLFYQQAKTEHQLAHDEAMRALIVRILMAPEFLYRTEKPNTTGDAVLLSDWELASRLSFFLWSSIPDQELLRAAQAGELSDPEQLAKQARRMLEDPKSKRLAVEFFGQWFGFYRFTEYRGIDTKRFPEFTEEIQADLYNEAATFFEHLIRENRPVDEVLFADYAFLNSRLANHYGMNIKMPAELGFQKVAHAGRFQRGGLLGLGAVLTVTSAPLRTSPVKRGDWVLRRIVGTPVPPPPADAGSIPADDVLGDGVTIKQRLAAHRRNATCNTCHSRIDPLGFVLEQFDPIGRFRESYRDGQPIESSGELRDGSKIEGVNGLRSYLKTHREKFHRTLCVKLLGYAFGRSESLADQALIHQMQTGLKENDRFAMLVERIVKSPQFRFQRGMKIQTP